MKLLCLYKFFNYFQKDDKLFECDNLKGVTAPGTEVNITFTFKQQ